MKSPISELDYGKELFGQNLPNRRYNPNWKKLIPNEEPNTDDENKALYLLKKWYDDEKSPAELTKLFGELLKLKSKFPNVLNPTMGRSTYENNEFFRGTLLPLSHLIKLGGWEKYNGLDFDDRGAIQTKASYLWKPKSSKGFTSVTPTPHLALNFALDYAWRKVKGMWERNILKSLQGKGDTLVPVILVFKDTHPNMIINPIFSNLLSANVESEVILVGKSSKPSYIIVPNFDVVQQEAEEENIKLHNYFKGLKENTMKSSDKQLNESFYNEFVSQFMSEVMEDEGGSNEIKVGEYQTKYFHVCPGAISLYKDIESKGVDMGMAQRSAMLQDVLYFVEKHIQRDGYNPEKDYVMVAKNLAKNIMKLAEMMGLEKEHNYIQGHVDTIQKVVDDKVTELTEENVPTNPSKWSYYKSQAKKKFDVYPSAYANAWAAKQYKAAGGGWRAKKKESVNEELPTKEIDPSKFPNPLVNVKGFLKKGLGDGDKEDDIVKTKPVQISVSKLKPSQDAIYLGKVLGMAINGIEGGDLGAVISKDNYILDGHHRYAATTLNNPSAKVGGIQSDLMIGDLVPVLRAVGDAMKNKRGLEPKGGDLNIFKVTMNDVKDCVYNGKNMHPKFYNKEKSIEWFENIGEDTLAKRLKMLQSKTPPSGAPQRKDMPKINPEQLGILKALLNKGKIDTKEPYTKSVNEAIVTEGRRWGTYGTPEAKVVIKSLDKALAKFETDLKKAHTKYQTAVKEFTTGAKKETGSKSGFHDSDAEYSVEVYTLAAIKNALGMKQYGNALEYEADWMSPYYEGLTKDSVNEAVGMNQSDRNGVYQKLKKGDKVRIRFNSAFRKGNEGEFFVSKGKTKVGKRQVERIILKNVNNPRGVKYYLYNDNNNIGMAQGDMGVVITDMKIVNESVNEVAEPEIITQLKDIVSKKQNQKLKDPKTGKKMLVDLYSASAVTQVYDALKRQKNKDKLVDMGLVGMVNTAFKLLNKNESIDEAKVSSEDKAYFKKHKKEIMKMIEDDLLLDPVEAIKLHKQKNEVVDEYDVETIEEMKDFQNFIKEYKADINEAEYQGRDVKLGKIMQGDVKKFKVYVKNDKGNVVKVNFGQKGMTIKKDNPGARKSFRSRMNCDSPGPRWKARYWSCRKW